MATIIGRKQEIAEINELYNSDKPEFLAVYGRRRVGKTFLIKEVLQGKFTFYHTGLSPIDDEGQKATMKDQLESFYYSMIRAGLNETRRPKTWLEAFFMLENLLEDLDDGSRQVVFIDELPWMDTPRSRFLPAFESFWNGWGTGRDNLMLVICGSATTWMLDHIVNNRGGLSDRTTCEIHLSPFTLGETREFMISKNISLIDYDIAEAYMILGGIPYYLNYFKKGLSLAQNIDQIVFAKKPRLSNEFERLFRSLFVNHDLYKEVVRFLSTKHAGFTRNEIAEKLEKKSGGNLSDILKALKGSEFIDSYTPLGSRKDEVRYRLIDPFCRFYLTFVEKRVGNDYKFWENSRNTGVVNAWRGITFEELCMMHIEQIKEALKVGGVLSTESAYSFRGNDKQKGSQMDLIISRNDHVVNLCEMKFSLSPFIIDNEYAETLQERIDIVRKLLDDDMVSIHLTFITVKGVKPNIHSGIVQKEVLLKDLFE